VWGFWDRDTPWRHRANHQSAPCVQLRSAKYLLSRADQTLALDKNALLSLPRRAAHQQFCAFARTVCRMHTPSTRENVRDSATISPSPGAKFPPEGGRQGRARAQEFHNVPVRNGLATLEKPLALVPTLPSSQRLARKRLRLAQLLCHLHACDALGYFGLNFVSVLRLVDTGSCIRHTLTSLRAKKMAVYGTGRAQSYPTNTMANDRSKA
jgi:hypothetical protein